MVAVEKRKVFISYSWDDLAHQKWVLSLADQINKAGGDSIVDRTHLKYGGHIKSFMIKSITDADIVLIILTPNYKRKAESLSGGAGYEYNIINDELFKLIQTNEKFIPIIRSGNIEESTTAFLRGFNCVNLVDGESYEDNLKELLTQILNTNELESNNTKSMETEYKSVDVLSKEMLLKASHYFQKLFVPEESAFIKAKLQSTVQGWDEQIEKYTSQVIQKFSPQKMQTYESYLEDFKNNIFAKELWTVSAALRTRDPELARYKGDYRDADAEEIYDTVNGIMNATHKYVSKAGSFLDYKNLKSIADLGVEYLNNDEMFMNRVIGFGIRSEILHRYYPMHFPIMTQKNLWAMYFLCESSNEFITVEQKTRKGIMRVSHNWQYPYDRFIFLMNVLSIGLEKLFAKHGIKLNPLYRFAYVNLFQYEIHDHQIDDIRLLHEWVESERNGRNAK
ncbi:MAG TPA: toll/interleukin-1 receptor domain-containing protein [Cyclobacteriaceae bacterium]|nr:toll/interleukin-1 receptor domain-containing protein [Cyclobacteriaceae bacterium]